MFLCCPLQYCSGQQFASVVTWNIQQAKNKFLGEIPGWGVKGGWRQREDLRHRVDHGQKEVLDVKEDLDGMLRHGKKEDKVSRMADGTEVFEDKIIVDKIFNHKPFNVEISTSSPRASTTNFTEKDSEKRKEINNISKLKEMMKNNEKHIQKKEVNDTKITIIHDDDVLFHLQNNDANIELNKQENTMVGKEKTPEIIEREGKKAANHGLRTMNNIYVYSELLEWGEGKAEKQKERDVQENTREETKKTKANKNSFQKGESYAVPISLYDWYSKLVGKNNSTRSTDNNMSKKGRKKKNVDKAPVASQRKSLYAWYQEMRKQED